VTDLDSGKSLLFGSMELIDPNRIDVSIEVLAEGTTWGNPQPIEVAVRSLMQQGTNVVNRGWDNRDGTGVRVKFKATDLDKIAAAEAELMAEIGHRNTLTWTPPNGLGAPTQFVIVTSSFDYIPNDVAEVLYPPSAQYSIRLIPEPFPRSTITVRAPALSPSGTARHSVDDCTSAAAWTGFPDSAPTPGPPPVDAGHIRIEGVDSGPTIGTRTGAIDTSSLKYLEIIWRTETADGVDVTAQSKLRAIADDVELPRFSTASAAGGDVLTVFLVPDDIDSIDVLRLERTHAGPVQTTADPPVRVLLIGDVAVSDIRPSIGTLRQLNQTIAVDGSAPAEGSLVIEHETSALGDVLVYVSTENYLPSLRPRRISGDTPTPAPDSTVSGFLNILGEDVYDIPVSELPDGTCVLMAHLRYTGVTPEVPLTVTWSAATGPVATPVTGSTDVVFADLPVSEDGFGVVVLGEVQLPDWQFGDDPTAIVRIILGTHDGDVDIDDAWVFNTDAGYLTHVRCGHEDPVPSGASNRLWLAPATIETNIPKVLRGYAADQSDAFHPAQGDLVSWMPPYFEPPLAFVHLVTTRALDAKMSLEHQPRWHTRARRVIGQ
jgi:hypothetical protein